MSELETPQPNGFLTHVGTQSRACREVSRTCRGSVAGVSRGVARCRGRVADVDVSRGVAERVADVSRGVAQMSRTCRGRVAGCQHRVNVCQHVDIFIDTH